MMEGLGEFRGFIEARRDVSDIEWLSAVTHVLGGNVSDDQRRRLVNELLLIRESQRILTEHGIKMAAREQAQ